jgi:hypothetical protein
MKKPKPKTEPRAKAPAAKGALASEMSKPTTNRLGKAQREALLGWICDGLHTDEINARAAEFSPPFAVSRQQVDHYRSTREVKVKEIVARGEDDALTSGLALRGERVRKLKELAAKLEVDVDERWLKRTKIIGSGDSQMIVDYEEYNSSAVTHFFKALDDIAAEVGERGSQQRITAEKARAMITALVEAVRKHVHDPGVLSAISAEFGAIVGGAGV